MRFRELNQLLSRVSTKAILKDVGRLMTFLKCFFRILLFQSLEPGRDFSSHTYITISGLVAQMTLQKQNVVCKND